MGAPRGQREAFLAERVRSIPELDLMQLAGDTNPDRAEFARAAQLEVERRKTEAREQRLGEIRTQQQAITDEREKIARGSFSFFRRGLLQPNANSSGVSNTLQRGVFGF